MLFNDLRDFITEVDKLGECKIIESTDWDLELGLITELFAKQTDSPLLVFDSIKDYEKGYRVAANLFTTQRRTALALGLPLEAKGVELVRAWREKTKGDLKLIPPVEVKTGPVKENIDIGDDVNLYKFPVPKWHELDGGRYIGTADMVITRDPEEGWVNLGTHRVQVQNKNRVVL